MFKNEKEIRKKIFDTLHEINSEIIDDNLTGTQITESQKTTRIKKSLNAYLDLLEENET